MKSLIREKSFYFALRIIRLYKYLIKKKEYSLADQILRSGTSIGANIEEALGAFSKREFIVKMQIAYKESLEINY